MTVKVCLAILHSYVLPIPLTHTFFHDAAHFSARGTAFDCDVQVAKAFSIHEEKTLFSKGLALASDVLGFTVAGVVSSHGYKG